MATDVIADLYAALLTDPNCPVELQHRAYDYGIRRRKPKLLALLAASPGTCPELDAALADHPQHSVRAAWLCRPGRPVADILTRLDGEDRLTVLAAVATVPGLPDVVYERISGVDSLKTATALLGNPSAPLPAKLAAAAVFGAQMSSDSWVAQREVSRTFTGQPELLDALASRTTNVAALKYAAANGRLREDTVAHAATVLRQLIAEYDPKNPRGYRVPETICDTIRELADRQPLAAADRTRLRLAVAGLDLYDKAARAATLQVLLRPPAKPAAAPPTETVRAARGPAELDEAVRMVLRTQDETLAAALADNPACAAERLARIVGLVPREALIRLVKTRARDVEVLAVLLSAAPYLIADAVFAASGQPVQALIATVQRFRETGQPLPRALGESEYATADVVTALPVDFLARSLTLTARRATTATLLEQLGDGDRCWQTFEALAGNFPGSLGNLLTAVTLVEHEDAPAGPARPAEEPADDEDAHPGTLF